jgi:hypothetical protein
MLPAPSPREPNSFPPAISLVDVRTPTPSEFETWLAGRQFHRKEAMREVHSQIALGGGDALFEERRRIGRCPICASRYAPGFLERLVKKPWCDECEKEGRTLKKPLPQASAAGA